MFYILTLTDNFQVTKFEMWISGKLWKLAKNAQVWRLQRLIFAIEWDHGDWRTSKPCPSFSRTNIFLLCICYKIKLAQAVDIFGRFASTCTAPPHRRVTLVSIVEIFSSVCSKYYSGVHVNLYFNVSNSRMRAVGLIGSVVTKGSIDNLNNRCEFTIK